MRGREASESGPAWRIWDDRDAGPPEERVARDAALLEEVRRGVAAPTARVWANPRCLVAARAEGRLPAFARAAERMAAEGWPVAVRESGGTAVPHAAGVLQLSLAYAVAPGAAPSIEGAYRALLEPVACALRALGLEPVAGRVPGAFCDGRFDLAVGGRKLVGTAQRWRARPSGAGPGGRAVLAHAMLLVDLDLEAATAAVSRFYALAGAPRRVDPAAATTVRAALAATGSPLAAAPPAALVEAVRLHLLAAAAACLAARAPDAGGRLLSSRAHERGGGGAR